MDELNTKEKELSRDTINLINDTFSHLMTGGKTYCVHDTMDNCFETIEEIREAVRSIVKEAIRNAVAERNLEIEKKLLKKKDMCYLKNGGHTQNYHNLMCQQCIGIDIAIGALKGQKEGQE